MITAASYVFAFTLAALVTTFGAFAHAEPPDSVKSIAVSGWTLRVNGARAPGILVRMSDPHGREVARDTSDVEGAFDLGDLSLEPGLHLVLADHPSRARAESLWIRGGSDGAEFSLQIPPGDVAVLGDGPSARGSRALQSQAHVTVWFGTNRRNDAGAGPPSFGPGRSTLTTGRCEVSIPRDHRIGRLETPFLRLGFLEDPRRHVVLGSIELVHGSALLDSLSLAAGHHSSRDVLVFVHGYNVSFVDAARRAAQVAYDLQWVGPSAFFSWPTVGTLHGYTADEAAAEASTSALEAFLALLARSEYTERIHLIAHSMGARIALNTLERLATSDPSTARKIHNLVLAAPDVDVDVYREKASRLRGLVARVTTYASSRDVALAASATIHRFQRAGASRPNVTVVEGVDTIDATHSETDLLGHGYFPEARTIVGDLYGLLRDGKPPDKRFSLKPHPPDNASYWILSP